MFPDTSCEVSALKKQAYLIGYEMYCCLALRKPQDPGLVFLSLSLLRQLSKLRIAEVFSSAEKKRGRGKLGMTFLRLGTFSSLAVTWAKAATAILQLSLHTGI